MITLYDDETSADCYQVRVLLGVVGLEFRCEALEEFVPLDPDAPAPAVVLVDARQDPPRALHDASAALLYLSLTEPGADRLLGTPDASRTASVLDWLSRSRGLAASAGAARRHESFAEPVDLESARSDAHRLLRFMDRHLWFGEQQDESFLAGEFSLADIACFGDVVLAEEGGVGLQDYPAVRRWCDRVKRVPGLPLMSGIFPAAPERTP